MMDELLKRVTEKTGLNPDQAKHAVDVVLGFLKEKLPPQLASSLDAAVGKGAGGLESASEGVAGKAGAVLGNLFGKKSRRAAR